MISRAMKLHGASMKDDFRSESAINDGHVHEALDRCHVIASMIEDHLLSHPYMDADAEVKTLIESASDAIGRAYQLIGGSNIETAGSEVSNVPSV